MTNLEKLLCELIALPSVNPAFLSAGEAPGENSIGRELVGESRVGDFLAASAAKAGLDVEMQEVAALPGSTRKTRRNVFLRLSPGSRPRQRILLAPHMDTVGAAPEQFRPALRGGKIFGRGACDTKGSITAMFSALSRVARAKQRPKQTEIVLAAVIDEEVGQMGSRALVKSGLKADLAIVGEPTCLQVVSAHKGSLWLSLETAGKAAHGSRPELGKNAVHSMARIVDLLQTEYAAILAKRPTHELLGKGTVSVGVIFGGTQPNIVPDRCTIRVDRRTLPGETEHSVASEIRAMLKHRGLHAKIGSDKNAPCLSMETDPKLPLVQQFLKTTGQRKTVGVKYFCDGAVLAQGGIPSIVFGPGDIAQAHTAKEYVSTDSLAKAEALLYRFLSNLD
jgi:acetylornithine deacetylase/succinyl-diaminopimelate desuccinylase family protein